MENKTVLNEQHLEVLRKIREYAPSAVIGGGAARDLYFNQPFRDVDIFIPVREVSGRGKNKFPGNIFFEEVIPELLRLRLGCEDTYEAQMDYFSTTIGHIYDCQMELGNFQFIGTKASVLETIGNSDFGLNCIYHDGKKLTPLPPFEESVKKKMITPNVPVPRQASKFYARMVELQKKYPDFTIPNEWIAKIEAAKKAASAFSVEFNIVRDVVPPRRNRRLAEAFENLPHEAAAPVEVALVDARQANPERWVHGDWRTGDRVIVGVNHQFRLPNGDGLASGDWTYFHPHEWVRIGDAPLGFVGTRVVLVQEPMPFDNPPHVEVQHNEFREEMAQEVQRRQHAVNIAINGPEPQFGPVPEPANPVPQRRGRRGLFGR